MLLQADISIRAGFYSTVANVRAQSFDTNTPLHAAVGSTANVEVCKLLLERGAAVDKKKGQSYCSATPLALAVHDANHLGDNAVPICSLLLDNKANVNAKTGFAPFGTILHIAAQREVTREVCELLLNRNADPELTNKQGISVSLISTRLNMRRPNPLYEVLSTTIVGTTQEESKKRKREQEQVVINLLD